MQEVLHGVVPGALVQARGERWRVVHTRNGRTAAFVTLDGADEGNRHRSTTLLVPFDRLQPIKERPPRQCRRDQLLSAILHVAACDEPSHALWTALGARMELWPWQLAPALAVLRDGATRLLLADAVGLGKTIQAGLILAELRARGLVERALVLAPAALRAQWADELRSRFAVPAQVLDLPALIDLGRAASPGANPWSRAATVVSSIDLVKRAEIRAAIDHAPIDLLVVDEAHHATPGTDRHAVISHLARQAPWVVLVSATPHSGDPAAYQALLALGMAPAERSIRVFRRTHDDAGALVPRRARPCGVSPTPEERCLHDSVLAYARRLCHTPSRSGAGVQLLAATLARRATSSARAVRLTLERRLAALSPGAAPAAERLQPLPWEETDGEGDAMPWLDLPGFDDSEAERRTVLELIDRAIAAERAPSKIGWLRRFVARVREPVIVFSEFRDTLEACGPALASIAEVVCLHGDLDAGERSRRLAAFLRGEARVLLTTDVAGEGLNLHRAARLVVTVEWPWSPLRLEQRVGRVHRLGQARVVHAVHLTAAGSYEDIVVSHLAARAARADAALAQLAPGVEEAVAALVLGLPGRTPGLAESGSPAADNRSDALARIEARRVQHARTLLHRGTTGALQSGWTMPRGRRSGRVAVLVEVMRHLASGWPRSRQVVPLLVVLRERIGHRRRWRGIADRLGRDPRVARAAFDAAADGCQPDQWRAVRERLLALADLRRHREPRPEVQPSLFDHRALRAAEQQARADAAWDDWHRRLQSRLAADPISTTTRVRGILPLEDDGQ